MESDQPNEEQALRQTPKFEPVSAPVKQGAPLGKLEAWQEGKLIGETPLVAASAVEAAASATSGGLSPLYLVMALIGTVVVGYGTALPLCQSCIRRLV